MNLKSTKFLKSTKNSSTFLWLFMGDVLLQGLYLWLSQSRYKIGFPLDDAWIHQTYARNFALSGVWAFNPQIPSAGSTSPLWSFLLVPGHLFDERFFLAYTFVLGGLFLLLSAFVFEHLISEVVKSEFKFPVFGFLFLLEWHFLWAANSGMETILFVFLLVLFFNQLFHTRFDLLMGLILAAIIWVRPDGITILGPLVFVLVLSKQKLSFQQILKLVLPVVLSVGLYFWFNWQLTGTILPNTFYAKQTEYAVLYQQNFFIRLFDMLKTQFVGVGILLLPGLIFLIVQNVKKPNLPWIAAFCWWFGYLFLYALRLPVVYQHGRYQIPALGIFFILAVPGCCQLIQLMKTSLYKSLKAAWLISGGLILVIFCFMGADAYANDVAIIETEMVNTAKWISENTTEDAKIAAHDIGALGFFGNRAIIDLAGLISPEVIPFMDDEHQLAEFLIFENPDYLMTFETWYEKLPEYGELVYESNAKFSTNAGGDSMQVFIWNP